MNQHTNPTSSRVTSVNKLLVPRILWGAMAASAAVYGFVLKIITDQALPEEVVADYTQHPLFMQMFGAGAMSLVLAFTLPRILAQQVKSRGTQVTDQKAQHPAQPYLVPFIVRLALIESVAIFGLVLGFVTHNISPFYLFGAVSIFAILMCYPQDERLGFK